MLSVAENELLTRTDKGTIGGDYLRGDLYRVRAIAVPLEDKGLPFYEEAKDLIFV